jgi:hypothetical protein
MYRIFIITIAFMSLQACGTMSYSPEEHELRDGLIPKLDLTGEVLVLNVQESKDPVIVYSYGGTKLQSTYHDITSLMAIQTEKEIRKNGHIVNKGKNKTIDLKVTYLLSTYKFFHWKSEIRFTAKLGNGKKVTKIVNHGSGSLQQDLDGCIAEGVIYLLNDEKVIAYLAGA